MYSFYAGHHSKNKMRLWLTLFLAGLELLIFSSCATLRIGTEILSGQDRDRELSIPKLVWRDLTQEEWSGEKPVLRITSGRIRNPPLAFWAVAVDLKSHRVSAVIGPGPLEYGIVPAIRVSSFLEQYNCLVAINTNPFNTVSDQEGDPRTIVGIAMQEGLLLSDPEPPYGALLFYKDGTAKIIAQKDLLLSDGAINFAALESVSYAVGGFFPVLKEGLPQGTRKTRHPRSAVGVSKDGQTLFLLAIDGRLLDSIGTTEQETGQILAALGAWEGLLLDGGGSTSLVIQNNQGDPIILNHPVHEGTLNRERAVATCLGFRGTGSQSTR